MPEQGNEHGPPPLSTMGFMIRLIASLGVIACTAALYAAWEASPPGPGRVWMVGLSLLAVPVLWVVSEVVSNPVLVALERQAWWGQASSALRVALGVLTVLPFAVVLIGSLAFFRRVFGVAQ